MKAAFTRVLASAIAAGLAYWLANLLLGHNQPIFAAISAIICLAPGVLNHFRQSINLLAGVSIGILCGGLIFRIPYDLGELRFAIAAFVSMLIASAFNMASTVSIQAGASALLVILLGPENAGLSRFLDLVIGVAIGMSFAIIFFRSRFDLQD
ncbi:FUSC family protein [Rhizobium sp. KVB221]|uniref:FUSC family protein n=2 Tax=Rhizobium setariae TaxID=2801340 RepID=A0A936YM73_9HYPH|nr:FUSC family protein [Rhizobium setariae]